MMAPESPVEESVEIDSGPEKLEHWATKPFIDRILLVLGITLYGAQIACVYEALRFKIFGAGIRRGKSYTAALMVFIDLVWMMYRVRAGIEVRSDLGTRWAIVGPDYNQCRAEMLFLMGMCTRYRIPFKASAPQEGKWTIWFPTFKGFIVETFSSKDVTVLAQFPYRGMVIAEAGKHPKGVYETCTERVSEDFGWVFICGTFEQSKDPWYTILARLWESPHAEGKSFYSASWELSLIHISEPTRPY